jgi:hypothetical protein
MLALCSCSTLGRPSSDALEGTRAGTTAQRQTGLSHAFRTIEELRAEVNALLAERMRLEERLETVQRANDEQGRQLVLMGGQRSEILERCARLESSYQELFARNSDTQASVQGLRTELAEARQSNEFLRRSDPVRTYAALRERNAWLEKRLEEFRFYLLKEQSHVAGLQDELADALREHKDSLRLIGGQGDSGGTPSLAQPDTSHEHRQNTVVATGGGPPLDLAPTRREGEQNLEPGHLLPGSPQTLWWSPLWIGSTLLGVAFGVGIALLVSLRLRWSRRGTAPETVTPSASPGTLPTERKAPVAARAAEAVPMGLEASATPTAASSLAGESEAPLPAETGASQESLDSSADTEVFGPPPGEPAGDPSDEISRQLARAFPEDPVADLPPPRPVVPSRAASATQVIQPLQSHPEGPLHTRMEASAQTPHLPARTQLLSQVTPAVHAKTSLRPSAGSSGHSRPADTESLTVLRQALQQPPPGSLPAAPPLENTQPVTETPGADTAPISTSYPPSTSPSRAERQLLAELEEFLKEELDETS